jgi:hypothetical protein
VVTVTKEADEPSIALSAVSASTSARAVEQRSLEGQREDACTTISLVIVGAFAFIIAGALVLFLGAPQTRPPTIS